MRRDKHFYKLSFKSLPYIKKKAQDEFNAFIRNRDKGGVCISCGNPLGETFHAGHFFSVGAHPSVRFDEENVWGQCIKCNYFLSANLDNYFKNLVNKLGAEKYYALELRAYKTVQRKKIDYINIYLDYKEKNAEMSSL